MSLLQKESLTKYKTQLGATDAEIAAVNEAAANLQYIKNYLLVVDAERKTLTSVKSAVYNGDEVAEFAGFGTFDPPFPLVAGLKEQFQQRNARYKLAAGYTEQIGIELGIVENIPDISPDSVKPTFEAHPAQTGYLAGVVVANRGEANMWKAFGQTGVGARKHLIGSGTGKAGNIEIEASDAGKPEQIFVTIELFKGGEPYGQPSDPKYVTFNP